MGTFFRRGEELFLSKQVLEFVRYGYVLTASVHSGAGKDNVLCRAYDTNKCDSPAAEVAKVLFRWNTAKAHKCLGWEKSEPFHPTKR